MALLSVEEKRVRRREQWKRWAARHPETVKACKRRYYARHAERIRQSRKAQGRTDEQRAKVREYRRVWLLKPENRERVRANSRASHERNIENERIRGRAKYYRDRPSYLARGKKNRAKTKADPVAYARQRAYFRRKLSAYNAARKSTDVQYRLLCGMRSRLSSLIKKSGTVKAARTVALIGCSLKQLRTHIEDQFLPGMTWENYGVTGWHIDHIKPAAQYDLTDPDQQRECFCYRNLQPLWSVDNIRKSNRLDWQPPTAAWQ